MKDEKKGLLIKNVLSPQKSIYPVVPLRNIVVFPDMTMPQVYPQIAYWLL